MRNTASVSLSPSCQYEGAGRAGKGTDVFMATFLRYAMSPSGGMQRANRFGDAHGLRRRHAPRKTSEKTSILKSKKNSQPHAKY